MNLRSKSTAASTFWLVYDFLPLNRSCIWKGTHAGICVPSKAPMHPYGNIFFKKKINMTPKLNSKLLINKFDVPQNKGEICPENLLSLNVSQQI